MNAELLSAEIEVAIARYDVEQCKKWTQVAELLAEAAELIEDMAKHIYEQEVRITQLEAK